MSKFIRCLISIQMRAALSLRMMSYANDWLCIYWSGANVKDGVWFTENMATLPRSHSRSTIFLPTTFPENMKLWAQVRYPHDRQNVTLKTIISITEPILQGLGQWGSYHEYLTSHSNVLIWLLSLSLVYVLDIEAYFSNDLLLHLHTWC